VKYCERLFGGKRHVTGLLDPSLAWTEFVPAEARALWRKMADRHAASRGAEFGVRAAEGMVDAIYSVAAWLREEHRIPADAARPPAQWRKSLKEEWAQRTGKRRSRPHRPRHTVEEYRRIFAATTDPHRPAYPPRDRAGSGVQNGPSAPLHSPDARAAADRA